MALGRARPKEVPMRCFAMVVITKAENAAQAQRDLNAYLSQNESCVDVGNACPLGPAKKYETTEIRLKADGEMAVTVPVSPLSRSAS